MTQDQKNDFFYLTNCIGILESGCASILTEDEQKMLKQASKLTVAAYTKLADRMTAEFAQSIVKEIKRAKLYISQDGKVIKSQVIVSSWDLDTIIEHAMECCKECSRNQKACRLKVAYKKLNVPIMDPDQKGCPYRIEKE